MIIIKRVINLWKFGNIVKVIKFLEIGNNFKHGEFDDTV